jgi:PAS domain S-box-containing protein
MATSDHFEQTDFTSLGAARGSDRGLNRGAEMPPEIEMRVQQRTLELAKANTALLAEIVERKRVEEALRHAEAKYRSIFENAVEGIYQATPDGQFLSVNPALVRMYGYESPEELMTSVTDIHHQTCVDPNFHSGFKRLVEAGQGVRGLEYQVRRKEGAVIWISENARAVRDRNGTILYYEGTIQDITERKRAEEALRESEEKYRAFVETTNEWIWAIDNGGRITYSNPTVAHLLGFRPEELLDQNSFEYMIEEDRHQMEAMLPIFIADKWGWKDLAIRWRHKDGSYRFLETNATPILDSHGEVCGYRGTSRDIMERKKVEQTLADERASLARRVEERTAELSAANAELAKAARLKDEFLASMSHELRTPLNAILGLSEVLQEQIYGPLTDKQSRALNSVAESGRHLLALINDILDLSKIEAGKVQLDLTEVNIESVCQASLRLVKEAAQKKRLKLSCSFDSQVSAVRADERRLKQILVNLLSNAVKFTSEGGGIGLEITRHPDQPAVCFTVWDTGIGISEEDLLKLFQPFVQLDSRLARQYAGTGLGLALVRRMAEMHGGGVSVQSEIGKGSRFTISLPWQDERAVPSGKIVPAETASAPPVETDSTGPVLLAAGSNSARPLVLLVEDNEMNIESMTAYLQAKGFRVIVAREGGEAVQRTKEEKPEVILMDIQMPGMDGLEATRRIRADAEVREIPIIALTALAMHGDRERCLGAGANEYFSKPANLGRLIISMNALIKRQTAA